jgi:hypothetical protein
MTRRSWQTCANQIFDWHDAFDCAFFLPGEQGVLECGNGTTLAGEMVHFDGGNHPLDMGKWCTWKGEMVCLSNYTLLKTVR